MTIEPPTGQLPSLDILKSWIDESYRAQVPKKLAVSYVGNVGSRYFIDAYSARSFQRDSQTPRCSFHTVLHQPRLKFCTGFLLAWIDPVRIWV
jgi:hypothetical protein